MTQHEIDEIRSALEAESMQAIESEELQIAAGRRQLTDEGDIRKFITGGNAVFTLVSQKTGTRFTYKVRATAPQNESNPSFFVNLLNGPDNGADYIYIGFLRKGPFAWDCTTTKASRVNEGSPSFRAIAWFTKRLMNNIHVYGVDFYHEGRCARCGRRLTVPSSILSGFGPECQGKL